ncbi:FAD:protein FMN transferase [uncultured Algibacter sp.]|uniref:FAD:protein FMN transferase n=1 Tax=uncultured Algibacter sp. TaxID=298659 RepID=UPI0032171089
MDRLLILFFCVIFSSCKEKITNTEAQISSNTKIEGGIFGTFYQVTYSSKVNYKKQFDSLFYVINKSMSTYRIDSDISKLNRNELVTMGEHFKNVFNASKKIYIATNGAFDPTIGAVVNAWDFGPDGKITNLDSLKIDNLMESVGFNKVSIIENRVVKQPNTFIDFNAIAKGYAVDVIADFLNKKNVENYLVNIGGELNVKGVNLEKKTGWTVGIENPNFDGSQSWDKVFYLKDKAMATSGVYRKFKIDEHGNRYSHIINAKTGYPSKTNLLSISVIADDCMTADAYATAFKAMGIEKIKAFLKQHQELKVFLIFENENQEFRTLGLNEFP